jgi:hypothetical protein
MENLYIKATDSTPYVNFNRETGVFLLEGKSVPENAHEFYQAILNWLDDYIENPHENTFFSLKLDYFNIVSSKRILYILYKLNELVERGYKVNLEWFYHEDEDDMLEVGQDFAYMVKIPFKFTEYNPFAVL